MNKNLISIFFICFNIGLFQFSSAQTNVSPRVKYNFNPGWIFKMGDDSLASSIQVDEKTGH
jgi:hypothetical protein